MCRRCRPMNNSRAYNHTRKVGRGERIRTSDPLHPMQVRYQTAPRPDCSVIATRNPADAANHTSEFTRPWRRVVIGQDSAPQQLEDFLELLAQLLDDLLALGVIGLGLFAHQLLPRAADRKAVVVQAGCGSGE